MAVSSKVASGTKRFSWRTASTTMSRGEPGPGDRRLVDELDLATLGFEGAAATGRPGYHPATLLKLYLYGYMNQVQSSRRLEREAGRNVEVMWLTG